MEFERFLSLYISESQERLRTLSSALLELEGAGGGAPLEEAFRAAHTIKGMAATMGFDAVAERAHTLEDTLDEVRTGRRAVDRALVDELLAATDALERENERVAGGGETEPPAPAATPLVASATSDAPSAAAAPAAGAPPGTALTVRVRLEATCMLKGARAAIVLRQAGRAGELLGSAPENFGDEFDGELRLFVGAGADRAALEAAIRAAGEVDSVAFEGGADLPGGQAPGAAAQAAPRGAGEGVAKGAARRAAQWLRVEERTLAEIGDGVAELGVLCGRLESLAQSRGDEELDDVVRWVRRRVSDLEHAVLTTRMIPVGEVFDRYPRLVRDAARSLGKEIDFRLEGRDIELDRQILEEVADPLVHLLRNAVDHGLERPEERERAGKGRVGRLVLSAVRERSSVVIEVTDDGRGVARERVLERARSLGVESESAASISDDELLRLMSHPGLSTASVVSDLSGRGVGLDAVVSRLRQLGGAIALRSEAGRGTTFTIRLPVTLALTQSLRVRVGGEDYAIPLTHIAEVMEISPAAVEVTGGREQLTLRGEQLPLLRLAAVLGVAEPGGGGAAVIVEGGAKRRALVVDELVGREQIVVRGFDAARGTLPFFSGATLLADGRPALVLDPVSVS